MKKYLYYTLTLVGCWLLPIGVHTLVERYFTDSYIYMISLGVYLSILCIIMVMLLGYYSPLYYSNGEKSYFLCLMGYFLS